jgi:hypothetical protein
LADHRAWPRESISLDGVEFRHVRDSVSGFNLKARRRRKPGVLASPWWAVDSENRAFKP